MRNLSVVTLSLRFRGLSLIVLGLISIGHAFVLIAPGVVTEDLVLSSRGIVLFA